MKINSKMGLEMKRPDAEVQCANDGGHDGQSWHGVGRGHKCFRGSYAVCSIPGASLSVIRAMRVGGQAATGERVVVGHLRGAL